MKSNDGVKTLRIETEALPVIKTMVITYKIKTHSHKTTTTTTTTVIQ